MNSPVPVKSRLPLWLTVVPLVVALALYGLLWRGWAADFKAEIQHWLPASPAAIGGFPYRLEAQVVQPALTMGTTVRLRLNADDARINRGPWRPNPTVVRLEAPRISVRVGPETAGETALEAASGFGADIEARSALASINWGEGRLRRQSTILQAADIRLGAHAFAIAADTLELHLRELEAPALPATSPTREARGQLVLAGSRLRLGTGDALTLAAEILATGSARLTDYDRWADGGTLELKQLTLADGHGEILSASATLVPRGRTGLDVAGTITTVCPAALAAAFAGAPTPPEKRLRVPVRLTIEGRFDAMRLGPAPDLARRPRRDQEPDCPKLKI